MGGEGRELEKFLKSVKNFSKSIKKTINSPAKMARDIIGWVIPFYVLIFAVGFVSFSFLSFVKTFGGVRNCIGSAGDVTQCFFLGKSAWDWIQTVSGITIITGLATFAYTLIENNKLASQKKIEGAKLASQEKMQSIKDYYAAVDQILANKDLGNDAIKNSLIGGRTIAMLPELEGNEKVPIISYLINLNRIKGISLETANLSEASFWNIDLSGCRLGSAKFKKATLSAARLIGADLSGADLEEADLRGADLRGANLGAANLGGANLNGANLNAAYLVGAKLNRAYLSGAYLIGANLNGAVLTNADLSGADLSRAVLTNADLSGADLSKAWFLYTDLRSTCGIVEQQFNEEDPPLLCNSLLRENIKIEGGKYRDCGKFSKPLKELGYFETTEEAEAYVEVQRNKPPADLQKLDYFETIEKARADYFEATKARADYFEATKEARACAEDQRNKLRGAEHP